MPRSSSCAAPRRGLRRRRRPASRRRPPSGAGRAASFRRRTGAMLYVPEGCAHGYLTLDRRCRADVLHVGLYAPDSARGVRFDDPAFSIDWPRPVTTISSQDAAWPDFTDETPHDHRRHRTSEAARRRGIRSASAIVAAGYMGRGIALQILTAIPGHAPRRDRESRTWTRPSAPIARPASSESRPVASPAELESAIAAGDYAVTDDPTVALPRARHRGGHRDDRRRRVRRAGRARSARATASTSS